MNPEPMIELTSDAMHAYRVAFLGAAYDPLYVEDDDEPWPLYPQPRPDHRWLLVLAVVVLLGLYQALRKENRL